MMKRPTFSREFKLSILQELTYKSKAEICREHDLLPNLVDRWKREHDSYTSTAFQGRGNLYKAEAKNAHYERIIGRLIAEIDMLKKTQAMLREKEAEQKRRCMN